MPTVGINLLWLVPGVVGGSEEYTLRLLRAIDPAELGDLRIRIYGQSELFTAHPDLATRFDVRPSPRSRSKALRIVAENTWLGAVSRNDDIVHHAGGVVPTARNTAALVTIHDLQPLEFPDHFSPVKRRWLASMIPRSVRTARLVLVPSEFTAERVSTLIGIEPAKIRVVPHGFDPEQVQPFDEAADRRLLARYGRYLLLPAIAYPHKRHVDLVRALHALTDRFDDLSVVFTGRAGPETDTIARLVSELGLQDRVHQLGRVEVGELNALYRSAMAMVFPSAYEGFGNPVLEAMACGCPVICSDAGALPAVAGSAALIVPVSDTGALAAAIAQLAEHPEQRQRLIDAGHVQATRFPSARAAGELIDCYREALRAAG